MHAGRRPCRMLLGARLGEQVRESGGRVRVAIGVGSAASGRDRDFEHVVRFAVEAERLTQEQADERLTEGTQRITDMVNGDLEPGEQGFGPQGRRGPGGPGGAPEAPTDEEI